MRGRVLSGHPTGIGRGRRPLNAPEGSPGSAGPPPTSSDLVRGQLDGPVPVPLPVPEFADVPSAGVVTA